MAMSEEVLFSPLQINLILKKVLGFLEREDLFNCRLVNHEWNSIAVEFLKNEGQSVSLDGHNILVYLDLLKGQSEDSNLVSLDLSLNITDSVDYNRTIVNAGIEMLEKTNQQPTIASIKFIQDEFVSDIKFWKLLELASTGLKNLQTFGNFTDSSRTVGTKSFPKLRTIYCDLSRTLEPTENCLIEVINSALNLKNLTLLKYEFNNPFEPATDGLERILSETESVLIHLHELAITIHSADIPTFQALGRIQFHHLKSMKLHCTSAALSDQLCEFLKTNCPVITSLELYVKAVGFEMPVNLLKSSVPTVTRFGIYFPDVDEERVEFNGEIVIDSLIIAAQKLPSLQYISTDYGIPVALVKLFTSLGGNSRSGNCNFTPRLFRDCVFPKVTKVNIRIAAKTEVPSDILQTIDFIHTKMYPNLKTRLL